jgi:hypothetical protein
MGMLTGTMRLALLASAVAATAALALAGCGPASGPKVATAQVPAVASGGPTPSAAKLTDYDKALRYTRCLTAHGVATPDPVEGKPLVTYNIINRADGDDAHLADLYNARVQAHQQCKQYLPATWPMKEDPKDIAAAHAFIACMNQNGQPEPEADANGMVHEPTDDSFRSTPEYDAALRTCRHLYDDPANNDPANQ